jgi:hypothetical protein
MTTIGERIQLRKEGQSWESFVLEKTKLMTPRIAGLALTTDRILNVALLQIATSFASRNISLQPSVDTHRETPYDRDTMTWDVELCTIKTILGI